MNRGDVLSDRLLGDARGVHVGSVAASAEREPARGHDREEHGDVVRVLRGGRYVADQGS